MIAASNSEHLHCPDEYFKFGKDGKGNLTTVVAGFFLVMSLALRGMKTKIALNNSGPSTEGKTHNHKFELLANLWLEHVNKPTDERLRNTFARQIDEALRQYLPGSPSGGYVGSWRSLIFQKEPKLHGLWNFSCVPASEMPFELICIRRLASEASLAINVKAKSSSNYREQSP